MESKHYYSFNKIEELIWHKLATIDALDFTCCIGNKKNSFFISTISKILNIDMQSTEDCDIKTIKLIAKNQAVELNIDEIVNQSAILPWNFSDNIPINVINNFIGEKKETFQNYGFNNSNTLNEYCAYISKDIPISKVFLADEHINFNTDNILENHNKRNLLRNRFIQISQFIRINNITDYFDDDIELLLEFLKIDYSISLYYVKNNEVLYLQGGKLGRG